VKRLFLALWPDGETRKRCYQILAALDSGLGRQVIAGNLHVTLVFIGMLDKARIKAIQIACDTIRVKAFEISFDRLSYWQRPKIVCLTTQQVPYDLFKLAQDLSDLVNANGIQIDARIYCPHVTLVRKTNKLPHLFFAPIIWPVQSFSLLESVVDENGRVYKVINTWPFS
jgi:2'-5' RNA ligase